MTEPLALRGAHFVQSLERGLAVIRAFSAERPQLTLSEVARATGLDRDDIVYVARVPVSRIMTVSINVGTRFPAYAASMGHVLLAGLPDAELDARLAGMRLEPLTPRSKTTPEALRAALRRVRAQGWALVDQELEEGLRSVAAPIRDRRGDVVAAINVSAHAGRRTIDWMRRELLPKLLATAARIEDDLGVAGSRRRDRAGP